MKTGFLYIPDKKKWAPYQFEDGFLTVYNTNTIDPGCFKSVPVFDFQSPFQYLTGYENGRNRAVVFFVVSEPDLFPFCSFSRKVYFYFEPEENNSCFSGIAFHSRELEYFYDPFDAFKISFEGQPSQMSVTNQTAPETKRTFQFRFRNTTVNGTLYPSVSYSQHSPTPLEVKIYLQLDFPETNDIQFILDLYSVVFKFICFISNRKNIKLDPVKLHQKAFIRESQEEYTASNPLTMFHEETGIRETVKILEKTLPYLLLKDHFSELWQFIADNKLYIEHIPENSFASGSFTIARMILVMAAFEWNSNSFLHFTAPASSRSGVKDDILRTLDSLSASYSSKKKKYLKSFAKQIELYDISLSNKIVFALEKYEDIVLPFIQVIYGLNSEPLKKDYKEKIGERVQYHRNAFAHGNIEMKIDSNILLDLNVLQWLILCIVLDTIGFEKNGIKKIIHYFRDGNIHLAQSICDHYDGNEEQA